MHFEIHFAKTRISIFFFTTSLSLKAFDTCVPYLIKLITQTFHTEELISLSVCLSFYLSIFPIFLVSLFVFLNFQFSIVSVFLSVFLSISLSNRPSFIIIISSIDAETLSLLGSLVLTTCISGLPHNEVAAQICRQAGLVRLPGKSVLDDHQVG